MNHALGMMIESLVAVLLLLTIGYCIVLNRRLKNLKADERALHGVIAELVSASERAERAIAGLKLTVQDCDRTLGERLRAGERMASALEQQVGAAETLLADVTRIQGEATQPSAQKPPPDARAVVAAAHAFAERARSRLQGRAA
jgi:Domain of unknown function (DUF6468)